jgi:hypothetical protein
MTKPRLAGWSAALALLVAGHGLGAQVERPPATAADPVAAILDAFEHHPVVALGEGDHNNEQGHAFRLALLRHPRFPQMVNDIVVEFGNARYQPVVDRYVGGDDVAFAELRAVWENTTQLRPVWDVPIYAELLRAVRERNAQLPRDRRLRVLLGDPPIDWARVTSFADVFGQMREVGDRDIFPVRVIQREVLAKGRRALVVYGDQHVKRTPASMRPGCQAGSTIPCFPGSIVDQLESLSGVTAFTVTTLTAADLRSLQADVAQWQPPALAVLRDTRLGRTPYRSFLAAGPLMLGPDGKPQPEPPAVKRPIEEVFDAVLYVGPPSDITYARLAPALCADAGYVAMRRARMAMAPGGDDAALCGR